MGCVFSCCNKKVEYVCVPIPINTIYPPRIIIKPIPVRLPVRATASPESSLQEPVQVLTTTHPATNNYNDDLRGFRIFKRSTRSTRSRSNSNPIGMKYIRYCKCCNQIIREVPEEAYDMILLEFNSITQIDIAGSSIIYIHENSNSINLDLGFYNGDRILLVPCCNYIKK